MINQTHPKVEALRQHIILPKAILFNLLLQKPKNKTTTV